MNLFKSLAGKAGPLPASRFAPLADNPWPFAGLGTSLREEHDYRAEILSGAVPEGLSGTLYRNGPGLFDRGGRRKRMLLDGDGMLQAIDFDAQGVRYRNRFARTAKFVAEEAAGAFKFATWSTLAPGGPLANLGGRKMRPQAGVTTCRLGERVYMFDEGWAPFALDATSLDSLGDDWLGFEERDTVFAAHFKFDGRTGEWLHFGVEYGKQPRIHVSGFQPGPDGIRRTVHRTIDMPRMVYMHDWLVTETHFIFILHPAFVTLGSVMKMMLGLDAFASLLKYRRDEGNLVLVVPRDASEPVLQLEAEGTWVWHCLNAYRRGGTLVADFVAEPENVGIGTDDPALFAVMEGRWVEPSKDSPPSSLRRYTIDLPKGQLREDILADDDAYEMPVVNPRHACHRHRFGYLTRAGGAKAAWSALSRVDTETGARSTFHFGEHQYCMEPIFVPEPGHVYDPGQPDEPGWLLTIVYDGEAKRSRVAVLRADRLEDGPICEAALRHHTPISFHGFWHPSAGAPSPHFG